MSTNSISVAEIKSVISGLKKIDLEGPDALTKGNKDGLFSKEDHANPLALTLPHSHGRDIDKQVMIKPEKVKAIVDYFDSKDGTKDGSFKLADAEKITKEIAKEIAKEINQLFLGSISTENEKGEKLIIKTADLFDFKIKGSLDNKRLDQPANLKPKLKPRKDGLSHKEARDMAKLQGLLREAFTKFGELDKRAASVTDGIVHMQIKSGNNDVFESSDLTVIKGLKSWKDADGRLNVKLTEEPRHMTDAEISDTFKLSIGNLPEPVVRCLWIMLDCCDGKNDMKIRLAPEKGSKHALRGLRDMDLKETKKLAEEVCRNFIKQYEDKKLNTKDRKEVFKYERKIQEITEFAKQFSISLSDPV